MARQEIIVRIESLVVDDMSAAQAETFGQALRHEIQRKLSLPGAVEALRARPRVETLDAGAATRETSNPSIMGREVGRVVHQALAHGPPRKP